MKQCDHAQLIRIAKGFSLYRCASCDKILIKTEKQ